VLKSGWYLVLMRPALHHSRHSVLHVFWTSGINSPTFPQPYTLRAWYSVRTTKWQDDGVSFIYQMGGWTSSNDVLLVIPI